MMFPTLKTLALALLANLALSATPPQVPGEGDVEPPAEADRGEVFRDPPYAPRPRPDRDYPPELMELLGAGAKAGESGNGKAG